MRPPDPVATLQWVRRVNHAWIVRGGLKESAAAWLDYLAGLDDGRMILSCDAARGMCGKRMPDEDPKPWFYAGLFRHATQEEARRFLSTHHVTLASLPCMAGEPETESLLVNVEEDTRELMRRLRAGLTS